jgi:hypothetical protein
MAYTLNLDFTDSNDIPSASNQWRLLPYYTHTEGETYIVNDLAQPGEAIQLRKLNNLNGKFELIYNDVQDDGSGKYIIGIHDIIKVRTNWDDDSNSGYCGYIVIAYILDTNHINYAIYFTYDLHKPFWKKIFQDNFDVGKIFISPISKGIKLRRASSDLMQINLATWPNYLEQLCKNININVSFGGNETLNLNSKTYYRFISLNHSSRLEYYTTNLSQEVLNNAFGFISDDKSRLGIQYFTADDQNWRFDIEIFDGSYSSPAIDFMELKDKVNANWMLFGPVIKSPFPAYSPFYVYLPITSNQWSTASSLNKPGIYSITSSQNGGRNSSIYLLYSDSSWPNGILGGTVYNGKLYVVYKDGANVFVYSQNSLWIDDQESQNNVASPYYKEVLFQPSNFDLEAGPIVVSSNVVLGGISFYLNKLNILLNEVS